MLKFICILLTSLLLFASCAPKLSKQEMVVLSGSQQIMLKDGTISRQEQIEVYKKLEKASTKRFKGFSQEEVMDACNKVLKLIDPDDSTFTHTSDMIIMKRTAVISIVVLTGIIHDYWIIKSSKDQDVVSITLRMVRKTKDIGLNDVSIYPDNLDSTTVPIQNSALFEGEYYTFFKRVEYFLGIESTWYDCAVAEKKVVGLGMPKNIRNMCSLCTDKKPNM